MRSSKWKRKGKKVERWSWKNGRESRKEIKVKEGKKACKNHGGRGESEVGSWQ